MAEKKKGHHKKRKVVDDQSAKEALVVETLPLDMIKATVQMGPPSGEATLDEKEAFSLKIVTDEKPVKATAKVHKLDKIFISFP